MIEGEEKLIEGAKRGDATSFGTLYDHYLPPIYRFIHMRVGEVAETEDLAHEVFMSAWQNLHRYASRGFPFGSWLYQIARNRIIDYYRLKKPHVPIEAADNESVPHDVTLELAIDKNFSLEEVKQAITLLSPDQQDVLIMKFMEDMPHRDIARILEKSEGAIRLIQHRALTELRRVLKNKPEPRQV